VTGEVSGCRRDIVPYRVCSSIKLTEKNPDLPNMAVLLIPIAFERSNRIDMLGNDVSPSPFLSEAVNGRLCSKVLVPRMISVFLNA
jgi:hypothetical protein